MKKLIFTLLALVGTMSMNAQIVKLYKDNVLVATYKASEVNNVVFEEAPAAPATTGTEKRTGDIDVNWVQLWEDGPRFAEYNVGAKNNKAEDYGGYYTWGGTYQNGNGIEWRDDHNEGTEALTGNDDTATALWGNKWRMPTEAELEALLNNQNCTCTWTTQNGVIGLLCKGKENTDYSSNSVFLPAAGYCYYGSVYDQGSIGRYWSSTPNVSEKACNLYFYLGGQSVPSEYRGYGYSVRAVLKETPATTGVAKATIGGVETDVNWVQLWEGGPKFAEYNVGASSAADTGVEISFTDATAENFTWGANWCTPNKEDMEHLVTAAKGETDEKVKCEYTQENSVWGFKFTGSTDGYTDNSVFFPARVGDSSNGYAYYWSATAYGSGAWLMILDYHNGLWLSNWDSEGPEKCLVRPVLKN